tara:strand:+ start:74 stop:259 length:186 start_codon:yes stop_codon:yes gene_type:complete
MITQTCKLPEIEKLKELLRDEVNIVWYMRMGDFEGSKESIAYAKKMIKNFKKLKRKREEQL